MTIIQFQPRENENILYHAVPNSKWYIITWKIGSGIAGIGILTFILFNLLGDPTLKAGSVFLPTNLAGFLPKILYLGLIPLIGIAWVVDDITSTYLGEFILTDQRIWVRGYPYAWNHGFTDLEDIVSMTWRRDAIFIRQKSRRGTQVYMFAEGKQIVMAYKQLTGKSK